MIGAVLGWGVVAIMGVGAFLLYRKSTAPGTADLRDSALGRSVGAAGIDPAVNVCLPLPGQPERRNARQVFGCWAVAVGCIPLGEHEMHGRWDVDIGGWEHYRDTTVYGGGGEGSIWVPNLASLLPRIEAKMLAEVGSGWPAQPPNENDQSERSLRMDMRSCLWRAMRTQLRQPTNFGFSDWRNAMRYRGSRSRQDALRAVVQYGAR